MKSILDPSFRYTSSVETDLRKTFAKVRRALRVTDDPNVFANSGVWIIFDGTGAYTDLQGTGDLEGTVDDAANLITRIYAGLVHLR